MCPRFEKGYDEKETKKGLVQNVVDHIDNNDDPSCECLTHYSSHTLIHKKHNTFSST